MEAIAERLTCRAGPKRTRNQPDLARAAQDFFPTSPIIGLSNPVAPPVRVAVVDGADGRPEILGQANFGFAYEGPPTCVHGGVIAELLDEVMGAATIVSEHPGMTGTLTIRYRKPTPLNTDLRVEARFVGPGRAQGPHLGRGLPRGRADGRGRRGVHRGAAQADAVHRRGQRGQCRPGDAGRHPCRGPPGGGRIRCAAPARRRGPPLGLKPHRDRTVPAGHRDHTVRTLQPPPAPVLWDRGIGQVVTDPASAGCWPNVRIPRSRPDPELRPSPGLPSRGPAACACTACRWDHGACRR